MGLGTFTLVVNGRMVIGTVRTPDAVYTIRTAGDGTYVIRQIDESSLPPLGEPLEGPVTPRDSHTQADDVPSDDGSEIDVMVVYTPLAKHREGGRAAIEALIDLFVAETNQAYVNSGVTHRIRLVLREEVDYTEGWYLRHRSWQAPKRFGWVHGPYSRAAQSVRRRPRSHCVG